MIELVGDIGSGKTTLTQGLVAGLGFPGDVPSPTFTIGRAYPVRDGLQLHHFDFYRLNGHDLVSEELTEALQDPTAIVVVEWAGNSAIQLPQERLRLTITPKRGQHQRTIAVESLSPESEYLIKELHHAYRSTD